MGKRMVLMVLFSVLMITSVTRAQDTLPPVLAVSKGDIYAISPVDGSITQITNHPAIAGGASPYSQRDMAISPDGQYLAYLQTPRFFAIAMKNNLIGNFGYPPSDVVLLNLATGEEKVIAEQQPNVNYSDGARLWYRENLRWSPDSSQIAYHQYRAVQGDAGYQSLIMIYDWLIDKTFTFVDSQQWLSDIAWLNEGISVGTTVYNTNSEIIAQHYLNEGMTFSHPLTYQGVEYAIVDSADVIPHDGRVYLMNLLTGDYGVVDGYQSSISAHTPDNSLVFIKDDNDTRPWYVVDPQTGNIYNPPRQAPYAVDFTFAPDGQHFAYILLGTSVNISDLSGKEVVVDLDADTIMWGGKQYTVANTKGDQSAPVIPTTHFHNVQRCGSLDPVDLEAGGEGRVIVGGGANRIRNAPSADAEKTGHIPEGGVFNVITGGLGVCSGGIRWAQIEYQGVIGWTAEGADGQVFLEPVR